MCKYVSDPVLLERDDVGPVKFDLRFVVMVTSVCPLQLAVHQKFIVRVANKSVTALYHYIRWSCVVLVPFGVEFFRVPTPPGKSWIFFLISRTWKVPENDFGPGNLS